MVIFWQNWSFRPNSISFSRFLITNWPIFNEKVSKSFFFRKFIKNMNERKLKHELWSGQLLGNSGPIFQIFAFKNHIKYLLHSLTNISEKNLIKIRCFLIKMSNLRRKWRPRMDSEMLNWSRMVLKIMVKIFIFGPETNPPRRAKPKISKSELNIYFEIAR